jgi:hypothetical protein
VPRRRAPVKAGKPAKPGLAGRRGKAATLGPVAADFGFPQIKIDPCLVFNRFVAGTICARPAGVVLPILSLLHLIRRVSVRRWSHSRAFAGGIRITDRRSRGLG